MNEFVLPDCKVTLLSGCSGQGKSSILESILFVLYDCVKKPYTFGKKKCKVVMTFDGISVMRQKGPNLLQITGENLHMENEVAQNWIYTEFGTLDQFYCASYIRQMEKHFIFTQGSTQIMDFIQTIAFGKEEIAMWKEKLQERKKEYDEKISNYNGRIQQQELSIKSDSELEQISREEIEILEKKSINKREEEILELELQIEAKGNEKSGKIDAYHKHLNKKKQVQQLKDQLDSFEVLNMKELEEEFDSIMVKLKQPVSTVKQELKIVDQELNKVKKSIGPNTKVDQKLPLLLQEKKTLERVNSLLQEFGVSSQSLMKSELSSEKKIFESLKEKKSQLEISIKSLQWSKIEEIDCPSCKTHLFYTQGNLLTEVERPEKIEIPIPNATEKDLGVVCQKIETMEQNLKEKEKIHNEIEDLTKNIKWTSDLDKKIENYNRYVELSKKKSDLAAKAELDKNMDGDQIQELEIKRQNIQGKMKQVHQYELLKSQYDTEKEILGLLNHVSQDDIADVDKEINKLQEDIKSKKHSIQIIKKLETQKKENEILDFLYVESRKWQQKSEACVYLKQKTQEAESLYLEEIMDEINQEINSYLSFIFDKNPMTLTFKSSKEIKSKKETKPAFDMDIFYKNEQYDNISQLSGGESAKCGIAILLAFNKILNSKFILLDESLNALDSESKLKVIDVLKNTGKTCVLISHDEIQGVFDQVLSI